MDIKEYISSGIIESYVFGLATEQEVGLLECVRQQHPEVEQAIREAQAALEDAATKQAIAPDASLKERIWDQLQAEGTGQVETLAATSGTTRAVGDPPTPVRPMSSAANGRIALAAAAAVLLACSIGGNIFLYQHRVSTQKELVQAEMARSAAETQLAAAKARWEIINNPAVKAVALNGTEDHPQLRARVYWDTEKASVYLMAAELPTAPEGMQYQLWAIVDGQPVDAGLLPLSSSDDWQNMRPIPQAQAFAITLEKVGGSAVPTLSELRVIGTI